MVSSQTIFDAVRQQVTGINGQILLQNSSLPIPYRMRLGPAPVGLGLQKVLAPQVLKKSWSQLQSSRRDCDEFIEPPVRQSLPNCHSAGRSNLKDPAKADRRFQERFA